MNRALSMYINNDTFYANISLAYAWTRSNYTLHWNEQNRREREKKPCIHKDNPRFSISFGISIRFEMCVMELYMSYMTIGIWADVKRHKLRISMISIMRIGIVWMVVIWFSEISIICRICGCQKRKEVLRSRLYRAPSAPQRPASLYNIAACRDFTVLAFA